ncbi:D-2-hydroxyacid dehydrogenase [uncultured Methanobrevibacter sp.]|uniref:D-2-hydroxyacid dehydrogenase n=1 Tax=uncultured Methanobrevibacter sp. TaxID=253161 RepID=UPI0025E833B7|nr:D-2-hydroxyacid dehydrogenase [uncultured Methanobrevibacter sp.]MCI6994416.1 D-2-hydroxyacid dehydrogenase [Methanobrevibacter sp.]
MGKMKGVLLEAAAINKGDMSWEELSELVDLTIYENTTEENKYDHIGDAEVIFDNKVLIDEEVFSKCPNIKYVGVCATGYNVIDTDAASKRDITVTNVPAYSTDSVVQLTWALILEQTCNLSLHNESVKNGDWINSEIFCYWLKPITELADKTLGIIGYGNIGKKVAAIAKGFGMNVLVNTEHPEKYANENINFVDKDSIFRNSDIISLHCPLTEDTKEIIRKENIDKMKDGVRLVNVSRGGLVNENDLVNALNNGKVLSAGVDVVVTEPMKADNPLLTAENIVITPHIGWASIDARKRLVDEIVKNYKAFLNNEKRNVVN